VAQKDIEIILARQFANLLATPVFIVDPAGSLLFYNEPAERVLGIRFEETGEMAASEWARIFVPTDENGTPLSSETLPLVIALNTHQPAHRRFWIKGLDNVKRYIEVLAFPIVGQSEHLAGAISFFWEVNQK
jgi:PAS domain-containing protein